MPAAPPRASARAAALAYARANRRRFVDGLVELVRFPSVGTQPEHADDVRRCAAWLASYLRGMGMRARLVPTARHPLVLGEWRGAPGRPTVLVYGHYDVQPAEPVEAWHSPPFEPEIRGPDLFGRGASDDKGQLWAHVAAAESWLKGAGRLPVNLVFLLEGQEESGSAGMIAFLRRRGRSLGIDAAIVSDMPMRAPGVPALTYAMRGGLSVELEVRGPAEDLHSGIFGGAVADPLRALCEVVAGLHGGDGRIAIPGFYDGALAPAPGERAYLRRTGPRDAELLRNAGASAGAGEPGWTAYERTTLRPSLTVNGVSGGYEGEGTKAVIASVARAKLGFRLAPGQDPRTVERQLRAHLAAAAPEGVEIRMRTRFGARPVLLDRRHPVLRAAAASAREAFGRAPVLLRSGGTIPAAAVLAGELGIPTVLMGFALPDDHMHAPDEKFHLPNLHRGAEASIRLLERIGRMERGIHLSPTSPP